MAGDFFEFVPPADTYLLRHVVHDWDDSRATIILRNCRKAMSSAGRVLVVEGLVPSGAEPSVSKSIDLAMLVITGGMERTEEEYRELFDQSGLQLKGIVPTESWVSVIEGEPV